MKVTVQIKLHLYFFLDSVYNSKYKTLICNVKQDEDSISKALGYRKSSCCAAFGDIWIMYFWGDDFCMQNQNDYGKYRDNFEAAKHKKRYLSVDDDKRRYTKNQYKVEVFQINA